MIVDDAIELIAEHYKCYMSYLYDLYSSLKKHKRQKLNRSQYSTRARSSSKDSDLRVELKQMFNELATGVYSSQTELDQATKNLQNKLQ